MLINTIHDLIEQKESSNTFYTRYNAGSTLGIWYWVHAAEHTQTPFSKIYIDCGSNPAVAYEALTQGFNIIFDNKHPAYAALLTIAQDNNYCLKVPTQPSCTTQEA